MLISNDLTRALSNVSAREAQAVNAFAPDTYFVVKRPSGTVEYTRKPAFTCKDGRLTDSDGQPVLGFTGPQSALGPIAVDPVDAALQIAAEMNVAPDGNVSYERTLLDPCTGRPAAERVLAGRVAQARFPAGTQLRWRDEQHAVPPDGTAPHFLTVEDQRAARRDMRMDQLEHAYLSLDALRAAGVAQSRVEKTAMDLLK